MWCEHVRNGPECMFCDDGFVLCLNGCKRPATQTHLIGIIGDTWLTELLCDECHGLVTELDNLDLGN
jgi:hypothetical protein